MYQLYFHTKYCYTVHKIKHLLFLANGDEHVFKIPGKAVKSQQEMVLWEKSEAYLVCYKFNNLFMF